MVGSSSRVGSSGDSSGGISVPVERRRRQQQQRWQNVIRENG
jgi:hypothetical protein